MRLLSSARSIGMPPYGGARRVSALPRSRCNQPRLRDVASKSFPDNIEGRLTSLIFPSFMQKAADRLSFCPSCGQHATGNAQQVGNIGRAASSKRPV